MRKLFLLILVIGLMSCSKPPVLKSIKTGHEGEGIPKLALLMPENLSYFNTEQLSLQKTNVFFYFSPTCPHCRVQMRTIVENMEIFKDVQFTILTIADVASTKPFIERYNLLRYPNIVVGIDTGFVFPRYFQSEAVPFTAIFGPGGRLDSAYVGSIGIEQFKTLTQHKSIAQLNRP